MEKFLCIPCGYIYDPAEGDPDGDIPAGHRFAQLPDDWVCPSAAPARTSSSLYEED